MYENDFFRDSSFDKSSSNEEEEEVDNDKGYKEKQKEIGKYKPRLSIFYSRSGDYFCIMRGTSFLLTKKYKHCQIYELEKAASNN